MTIDTAELRATPEEIAAVVKGLTKAQRKTVLTDSRPFVPCHRGKWYAPTIVTARKLFALGLIERPITLAFPTPLGTAVRHHMETTDAD